MITRREAIQTTAAAAGSLLLPKELLSSEQQRPSREESVDLVLDPSEFNKFYLGYPLQLNQVRRLHVCKLKPSSSDDCHVPDECLHMMYSYVCKRLSLLMGKPKWNGRIYDLGPYEESYVPYPHGHHAWMTYEVYQYTVEPEMSVSGRFNLSQLPRQDARAFEGDAILPMTDTIWGAIMEDHAPVLVLRHDIHIRMQHIQGFSTTFRFSPFFENYDDAHFQKWQQTNKAGKKIGKVWSVNGRSENNQV